CGAFREEHVNQGSCLPGNQEPFEDLSFLAASLFKRKLRGCLNCIDRRHWSEQISTRLSHPFPVRGKEGGVGLASTEFVGEVAGTPHAKAAHVSRELN